ncbi:sulfatase-like hydrolase/transferase [Pontiella sulfatireligans]|uniref:Arylsulfatase n=1 Tax=Pontiella sulfatireligans TaxID=2750658 RepID=A0A6C2UKJ3_9BACT|nr:sulfatase-like hydrolase/transferase [Pontiella sulfatireligans]SPS74422.1 sulfatase S1_30 [Kiritimatiellales bacterium]VGO20489.1 Arylsulfatase [Pontiella sulfatireligans]
MNRRNFTITASVTIAAISRTTLAGKSKQPNLLIIHTDEHNFRTLGCYRDQLPEDQAFVWGKGNGVETPHIDRIADEGAICNNYYCSSPICTPSRASFITGLHPQATGAPKNGDHIRQDIPTFATVLKEHGYATSYVGKWHLDGHEKYTFGIEYKAGFDDNRHMMRGGHSPFFQVKNGNVAKGGLGDKSVAKLPKEEVVHMTDFFTDATLEILERDKNKPFCIMLSIPDPHTPDYARPPYHTMYDHMDLQPPKTMAPEYTAAKPSWASKSNDDDHNEADGFDPKPLRQYFGMVKHIDDSVGRLLEFLDKNGLSENTIVIFTSDHGDMFFEHNRRNKGVPYEASAKIPFVIRYPKKIKAGKVINKAYTNVDFAPTTLALMGVESDAAFHGEDTSADFQNPEKKVVDDRITYFAKNGGWWVAAVNNRYKLILDKKETPWLIDLEKDPDELVNQYNNPEYKEIAKRLQDELFVQMEKFKEPGLAMKRPYVTE